MDPNRLVIGSFSSGGAAPLEAVVDDLASIILVFPDSGHRIPTGLDKRVDVGLDYIRTGRSGT